MKKFQSQIILTSVLFISLSVPTWAATPVNLRQQPVTSLQSLRGAQMDFKEVSRNVDFNNTAHIRIQQTYAGYPVFGATAVVHIAGNTETLQSAMLKKTNSASMNGIVYQNLEADLAHRPAYVFGAAQADKALQLATQKFQKTESNKQPLTQPKTNLIVYVDPDNKAHWAFLISFLSTPDNSLPKKPTYIMNAETFKIYKKWDAIQTLQDTSGGGFGGNKKTGKFVYDNLTNDLPNLTIERNDLTKICYLENTDVIVKDRRKNDSIIQFNCSLPDAQHKIYWDADQDAVNGAYSPANDALYAGLVIKKMYHDWYNLPVLIDGKSKPKLLTMRVHENVDNAYWDGEQMTFGDGIKLFYPLVSVGVAAHEISHGFTEQHSNLEYTGQSGGLNESFSDMAAQAAEFYSVGHNNWQIGPEILKANNAALRYMDEPTKDCNGDKPGHNCSISSFKDYRSSLDVHYSSGIFNKFFYLLSTSKSWDTRKAFGVMVQANTNYWTSATTFTEAACGVMSATKDYHLDVTAVSNAALGVGLNIKPC